ncbi:MAG: tRNA epoxyqueuosine(34) reductase QueG [Bacteroidota bacterium]
MFAQTEKQTLSLQIKQQALSLGFADCGMAPASVLTDEEAHLKSWIDNAYYADMRYYGAHLHNRLDPSSVLPNAKSIIAVVLPYYQKNEKQTYLKIARYALGKDYHSEVKRLLDRLLVFIKNLLPESNGKSFCDSGAMLEKAWANRCGLGAIGKNSLLIHPQWGSFVFIGLIVSDVELEYDAPFSTNCCERCKRCMVACPTQAIVSPHVVDARKCISYHTIESKKGIPFEYEKKTEGFVYGCDVCQEVCPYNQEVLSCIESSPLYKAELNSLSSQDLSTLSQRQFDTLLSDTSIARVGYNKLMHNIKLVMNANEQ